ncbi:MAG: hypothetical protein AAFR87_26745 [Bacteroidota bacterium]
MAVSLIIIGLIGAFIVSDRMYRKYDKDKEGPNEFTDYWDEKINRIGGDAERK